MAAEMSPEQEDHMSDEPASTGEGQMEISDLQYLINHVFLPPKLPQQDDSSFENDINLLVACEDAIDRFINHLQSSKHEKLLACRKMILKMHESRNPRGDLSPEKIDEVLKSMSDGDVLLFQLRAQNAGIIMRKRQTQVVFEISELSATAKAVMGTKGRLIRCFPGPAVAINSSKLAHPHFRKAIAQFLARLDTDTVEECQPISQKSKSVVSEVRDSNDPKLVTELFAGMLRGIGEPADAIRIHKRTRDEVLWSSAFKPWRRSPLWILLRVAFQSTLMTDGAEKNRLYKSFMIFFMAQLTNRYMKSSFKSDVLFIMTAKIGRRSLKLKVNHSIPEMRYVHNVVKSAHEKLDRMWRAIEGPQNTSNPLREWQISAQDFLVDTQLSLTNFMPYYQGIWNRPQISDNQKALEPKCRTRISRQLIFPLKEIYASSDETELGLLDVERWVQESLQSWLDQNYTLERSCNNLAELIQDYLNLAKVAYEDEPADLSLMFLTLTDLWVAFDRCVTYQYPIIKEYDTGFPESLFDPLLLPHKVQMERLQSLEDYLSHRREKSTFSSLLLFRDINKENSLAVRYYNRSSSHRELRQEIEKLAAKKKFEKQKEYEQKNTEYDRLIEKSKLSYCQCRYNERGNLRRDSPYCSHCAYKNQANSIHISVAEWPLPYTELEARSATFELEVPTIISKWRDITYTLLVDMFSPKNSHISSEVPKLYDLKEYSELKPFFNSRIGRLQLSSPLKPFVVTHYSSKDFPSAKWNDICVKNGLRYSLYDSALGLWTDDLINRCSIHQKCTSKLPLGPLQPLQNVIGSTDHTSNEIIAKQSECPRSMNLHEYYSFGILRSGHRLQWRNVLRELMSGSLDFSRLETYILVLQTVWQAGPPNSKFWRESHEDLQEGQFGLSLTLALEKALGTVEGNWQGANAVRTFSVIASRLLSMSPSVEVRDRCHDFLKRARKVSILWMRDVASLIQDEQEESQIRELDLRLLELALTCHETFNVDDENLDAVLGSVEAMPILIECCITFHDRCRTSTPTLPASMRALIRRFRVSAHRLEDKVRQNILSDRASIDVAIKRLWSGYCKGNSWTALSKPNDRWLMTISGPMTIHYNILDGSLLINGSPLGRLPASFESHGTYNRLFGGKILEVIPSGMEGMLFEIRNDFFGQRVHFLMYDAELIIRCRKGSKTFELIPHTKLQGDFPTALVEEYVHWLDINTGTVEWRPLKDPWTSPSQTWKLINAKGVYSLRNNDKTLLDIRSATAKLLSKIFNPLETHTQIHISVDMITRRLEIHLPRMNLDFSVEQPGGSISSKQFRGMVIDERQDIGSLTGLTDKLVLLEPEFKSRSVLIPYGEVRSNLKGQHVQVNIATSSSWASVSYHSYTVDDQLGRLVDNGTLQSRLFRLYLHALTSHCLPDRLTGRTGTEEALMGLKSGASNSSLELGDAEQSILNLIARLTPNRKYYPSHLKVMQQARWQPLPQLSLHCEFYKQVTRMFGEAERLRVFQETSSRISQSYDCGSLHLLERAALRNSAFYLYEYGAETFTTEHDCVYESRDNIDQNRELNVCTISRLVEESSVSIVSCPDLLPEIMSWQKDLIGSGQSFSKGFDTTWLSSRSDTFPEYFCSLLEWFQNCDMKEDKYGIMMLLSTLSYSQDAKQGLVQALLVFANMPALRLIPIARHEVYSLADGFEPAKQTLIRLGQGNLRPFESCPESRLPKFEDEDEDDADSRRLKLYHESCQRNCTYFAEELVAQWPRNDIQSPRRSSCNTYIVVETAMKECRNYFQSWSRNSAFRKQINQMQRILSSLNLIQTLPQKYSVPSTCNDYSSQQVHLSFMDLIGQSEAPELPTFPRDGFEKWLTKKKTGDADSETLRALLNDMASVTSTKHEQDYMQDLKESSEALSQAEDIEPCLPVELRKCLKEWMMIAKRYLEDVSKLICDRLKTGTHVIYQEAQMTPRLSPISILMHLASKKVSRIGHNWKLALIHYAKAIAAVQRAERLLESCSSPDVVNELKNTGHQNWDPSVYPDWLLMEIENKILIREDQALIAQEMIHPSSGQNSVQQLNMGKGKTSVIAPAIAVVLANGVNLARVIVLKPLARQMLHILVKKLGGMLNRRVLHLPVSRSLKLAADEAQQIRAIYEECQRTGTILLLQPEHLLSFELMGHEERLSEDSMVSRTLIDTQSWLDSHSRDILDESDEILSVRFELIYTIGLQRAIDFSPDRWALIQNFLGLIREIAQEVQNMFPDGLEMKKVLHGAFPQIRILQPSAGQWMLQLAAQRICKVGLPGFQVWHLSEKDKSTLYKFLLNLENEPDEIKVMDIDSFQPVMNSLLLLKGLFRGVVCFAFSQKRWRVNYGLDPSRSMLSVPYHAKDTPAPRSEFSHPDVTIVLTCLSYYYGGLTDEQIRTCIVSLLSSDHAQETYDIWVEEAVKLPAPFKHINGINLRNNGQCTREVFPPLRFSRSLINYFLSEVVFPKEMKEFPSKLSSSGWDIAKTKSNPTTGFSGTNDSRYILPLSIEQRDLPEQNSTNASVLRCLLRSENYFVDIHEGSEECMLNAENLLDMAVKLKEAVRVILDVGAQIIEMRNQEVASSWLSRVPASKAQAAVFFDDSNELRVIDRSGRKEALQVSPFAEQLDQCLIYLDEAHTRGTDLKLPTEYRALVTLGPNLPKDRLVQACMRMRKLGKGQAITFCCSKEVDRSIRGLLEDGEVNNPIEVAHILKWSIANTCAHTTNMIPLWATQGIRHQNRLAEYAAVSGSISKHTVESLLEPEAQTIEQRYGTVVVDKDQLLNDTKDVTFRYRKPQTDAIQKKCRDFQCESRQSAALHEEQERELSPEIQRQQEVERPPPVTPLKHCVHKDLRSFILEGVLDRSSKAFRPAFETFRETSAYAEYEKDPWSGQLYVTEDYAKSISVKFNDLVDSFLRPVHWIMGNRSGSECVVVSPYEANRLLPVIRQSRYVVLYPYAPRQSISTPMLPQTSQSMIPYSSRIGWLKPHFARHLDLFAGQLFFENYLEYESVCNFLGICSQPPGKGVEVEANGFIKPSSRAKMSSALVQECRFKSSPVNFVKSVVILRRKGLSYANSHLGRILNGELLPKDSFSK